MNIVDSFNSINSTSLRISITLFIFMLTALAYLFLNKMLDWEWLTFLGVMAGVDAVQYIQKRKTHITETVDGAEDSDLSSDVQELSNQVG